MLSPDEKGGALFARLIVTRTGKANLTKAVLLARHIILGRLTAGIY
jgi:hypothetical protein